MSKLSRLNIIEKYEEYRSALQNIASILREIG